MFHQFLLIEGVGMSAPCIAEPILVEAAPLLPALFAAAMFDCIADEIPFG